MHLVTQWKESWQECTFQTIYKLLGATLFGVLRGYRHMWYSGIWIFYGLLLVVMAVIPVYFDCFYYFIFLNQAIVQKSITVILFWWWLLLIRPTVGRFSGLNFLVTLIKMLLITFMVACIGATLSVFLVTCTILLKTMFFLFGILNIGLIFWPHFFVDSNKGILDGINAVRQSWRLTINTLPLGLFLLIGLSVLSGVVTFFGNIFCTFFFSFLIHNIFFIKIIVKHIVWFSVIQKWTFFLINTMVLIPLIHSFVIMYYIYTVYSHTSLYILQKS